MCVHVCMYVCVCVFIILILILIIIIITTTTRHCCALDINGHAHCYGDDHLHTSVLTPPQVVVEDGDEIGDGSGSSSSSGGFVEEEDGYIDEDIVTPGTLKNTEFVAISVGDMYSCGIR